MVCHIFRTDAPLLIPSSKPKIHFFLSCVLGIYHIATMYLFSSKRVKKGLWTISYSIRYALYGIPFIQYYCRQIEWNCVHRGQSTYSNKKIFLPNNPTINPLINEFQGILGCFDKRCHSIVRRAITQKCGGHNVSVCDHNFIQYSGYIIATTVLGKR